MFMGIVKWFNIIKGYGFIVFDGGGKDVFVYIFVVEQFGLIGLVDNMKIEFDLIEGCDGCQMVGNFKKVD